MSIAESLALLREEIAQMCRACGRREDEVTLITVSKTMPASRIREAHTAGARDFGENRVQEIVEKSPELTDLDFTWHMIGHLQTNKVRKLLPRLGLLHTLDRLELAEEIARLLPPGTRLGTLVQVNTTGEGSKSGVEPEGLERLVASLRAIPCLELLGLMTIGPLGGSEREVREAFALLRNLRDGLRRSHPDLPLPSLSMGMSEDFRLAIEEGSTHLRIGTRIFGPRG
jgi:PLP dependent protein